MSQKSTLGKVTLRSHSLVEVDPEDSTETNPTLPSSSSMYHLVSPSDAVSGPRKARWVFDDVSIGDIVEFKFKPIEDVVAEDGKLVARKHIYVSGRMIGVMVKKGATYEVTGKHKREGHISVTNSKGSTVHVYASTVTSVRKRGRAARLKIPSLEHPLVFKTNVINIGCKNISRKEAEQIFVYLGGWLGWDIPGADEIVYPEE
jgi:hypothetical protein